jgi:hypothetical protein
VGGKSHSFPIAGPIAKMLPLSQYSSSARNSRIKQQNIELAMAAAPNEPDDSEGDSDDYGVLFQQPTLLGAGASSYNSIKSKRPLAPSESLVWQQDAILECFQLAVESHDDNKVADTSSWKPPPFSPLPETDLGDTKTSNTELLGWEPKVLELPSWAAQDPPQKRPAR